MKKYNISVSGGSFDHFHKGHEAFIQSQLALSEKVLIGITSDTYIKDNKGKGIEDFATRLTGLEEFLSSQGVSKRVEIARIDDEYIPLVWQEYPIDAIMVTPKTKDGATHINTQREKKGLPSLPVEVIPEIMAKDGKPLSSSRIRNGEIDREGNLFITPSWLSHTLFLPQQLRETASKPIGQLFATVEEWMKNCFVDEHSLISIGDVITKTLHEKHFRPKVIVFDLLVQRQPFFTEASQHTLEGYTLLHIENKAGSITPQLWEAAIHSMQTNTFFALQVQGEEDLAVLPFVLSAPLGYVILYGQPHEGVVSITVTQEKKNEVKKILEKFTLSASH
jgi:pantetheine-phosphate adenylyltransferase